MTEEEEGSWSNQEQCLTSAELQALRLLDSRQFGFLKLNEPENSKKKAVVLKAIRCLEAVLVQWESERVAQLSETKHPPLHLLTQLHSDEAAAAAGVAGGATGAAGAAAGDCTQHQPGDGVAAAPTAHSSHPPHSDLHQHHQQQQQLSSIKTEKDAASMGAAAAGGGDAVDVKPDRSRLDQLMAADTAAAAEHSSRDCSTVAPLSDTAAADELMEVDRCDGSQVKLDEDHGGRVDWLAEARVYCKLGHYWLLLEKFDRALSAYQQFKRRCSTHWQDAIFLYGYALTLYHFNAVNRAFRVLLCVLYADPAFSRANEVHLRLALIYKARREFVSARKRFHLVCADSSVCSLTRHQIEFHIAHLYELCGHVTSARRRYESLLSASVAATPSAPPAAAPPAAAAAAGGVLVRAGVGEHVCRQLAWLLHCQRRHLHQQQQSLSPVAAAAAPTAALAVQLLQRALEWAPHCSRTLYLLGRCHSSQGKVHEAFLAYKQSMAHSEASADTWCSIGVLYQQHCQCMDALQAYVSAVQLDKHHAAAWSNLAVLYESASQPRDALACFVNAMAGHRHHHYSTAPAPAIPTGAAVSASSTSTSSAASTSFPTAAAVDTHTPVHRNISGSGGTAAAAAAGASLQTVTSQSQHLLTSPVSPSTADQCSMSSTSSAASAAAAGVGGSAAGVYSSPADSVQLLDGRVRLLKQQLASAPLFISSLHCNRPSRLPSIEEAWNTNTITEMTRETQKLHANSIQNKQRVLGMMSSAQHPPPPYPGSMMGVNSSNAAVAKRIKMEDGDFRVPSSSAYHASVMTPSQQPYISSQQQYRHRQQQQVLPGTAPPPAPPAAAAAGGVSESDVEAMTAQLLTRKDLAASLAEDLIRQFAQSGELGELEQLAASDGAAVAPSDGAPPLRLVRSPALSVDHLTLPRHELADPCPASGCNSTGAGQSSSAPADTKTPLLSHLATSCSSSSGHHRSHPHASTTPSSPLKGTKASSPPPAASPTSCSSPRRLHIGLSADQLAELARAANCHTVSNPILLPPDAPPPLPAAPPRTRLRRDQLLQQTPSVFVENKREAYSPHLFDFCLKNPIAVVRGMAAALKLDLGLFSTKTLVEANADHPVEVRTQVSQSSDENWDASFARRVWPCLSSRSHTTIAKYAQYQAASFTDGLREEHDGKQQVAPPPQPPPLTLSSHSRADSDSDSRDSFGKYQRSGQRRGHRTIRFGTNVDLSDERKWRPQLLELNKLPPFCRVVSACNMLSHVGHPILGMNTVQLYMKVPGSRTPGHQENNNFCALNINVGPGDCEWFGVPAAHWSAINSLCEKNGVSYLHGSWWPDLDELLEHGVPVYRFMQRPGDLVWVNVGCVHWVQAAGWCNNIAWNVGPLTGRQHCQAVERFEWNKLQRYKSIVPMQHLTWNLARNIRPTEPLLYQSIKNALMKSLEQVVMALEFVKQCSIDVKFHGRQKDESSHYCGVCDVEVFNILMVKLHERRHVVHCIDCARRHSPTLSGFVCLEEFKLTELMAVYDAFQLSKPTHFVSVPPTTALTTPTLSLAPPTVALTTPTSTAVTPSSSTGSPKTVSNTVQFTSSGQASEVAAATPVSAQVAS